MWLLVVMQKEVDQRKEGSRKTRLALKVSIQVEYLDRGKGGRSVNHVFPEGSNPQVFLLYHPGHYNIL